MRSGAFTLWLGFICHFSLRAFWIAMIGLANIFPQGIRYEHLPKKTSASYKDFLATKMPNYEQLISFIDKLSSGVLVVVFFLIMIFLATSIMYGGIVLILFLIMSFVPDTVFKDYSYLFFLLSFVLCFIIPIKKAIIILFTKRQEERKNELKYISQTATLFGNIIYHITLILKTNLPKSAFYIIVFGIVLISAFSGFLLNNNKKKMAIDKHTIDRDMYENTRNNKKYITKISLNSDVIKEKYVKIFLANTKELRQYTKHFEKFSVEKLEREEYKKQKKIFEIIQWRKFFKIYVNETQQEYELDFQTHQQTNADGFVVYLPLSNQKIGKNILAIKINTKNTKTTEKQKEITDILWTEVPFWYFP